MLDYTGFYVMIQDIILSLHELFSGYLWTAKPETVLHSIPSGIWTAEVKSVRILLQFRTG